MGVESYKSLSTFVFSRLSDKGQLEILLGKRSGNPIVDLRIDSAIGYTVRMLLTIADVNAAKRAMQASRVHEVQASAST